MSPYRKLSEMLFENAVKEHRLERWSNGLSEEKKEELLLGLDRKLNHLVCDSRKDMYDFVVTSLVASANPVDSTESYNSKNTEDGDNRKFVVRILHDGDSSTLSEEELNEIGESLVDRFANLLGM